MFFQSIDLLRGLILNNYTNSSHFARQLKEMFFLNELWMNFAHVSYGVGVLPCLPDPRGSEEDSCPLGGFLFNSKIDLVQSYLFFQ